MMEKLLIVRNMISTNTEKILEWFFKNLIYLII